MRRRHAKRWLASGTCCILTLMLAPLPAAPQSSPPPAAQAGKKAGPPRQSRPAFLPAQVKLNLARKSKGKFKKPQELAFRQVNELRLTTGTFSNPHGPDVGAPSTIQLLCYNGLPVGPTLRVRRGSTFKIHLKNDLPKGSVNVPPQKGSQYPASPQAEMPNHLCRTNLHTHGLHVSPADPADNIYLCRDPGEEKTFVYTVPKDHPSGTFWYHPHNHGSVAYQLSNGVAGALIVEGMANDGINDLEDIPEIAAAAERVMVFQLYNLRVRIDQQGNIPDDAAAWIDASTIYNVQADSLRCGAIKVSAQDQGPDGTTTFQVSPINGVINPTMTIAPGEVQRWRLIHAAWDLERHLTIVDDNDNPTDDLTFHEVAVDGLATGALSKMKYLSLAPGQRSDVLIKVTADQLPPEVPARIYHLKQTAVPGSSAPHSAPQDPLYLARIVVIGKPRPMSLPNPKELAKCRPFGNVQDAELSTAAASKRLFKFAADDGNTAPDPPLPYYTINGKAFLQQSIIQLAVGSAEEWTLTAKKSSHPFHIHVNAFQVVHYTDPDGNSTPMNVWRDTLYIKEGETYKIRSRFLDFTGKSVFHCHILDHEDQGMMMPIEFVKQGQPLPPQEVCNHLKAAAPKLQTGATPAPPLRLPDAGGQLRDLRELRGRKVLLVFFSGVECSHCADKLRELVRDAREANGLDAEVVAVSSRPVANLSRALKVLGVLPLDRFHLLVDGHHDAFRDFGCYDRGPLHGLFLIDREGVIRARYAGETPFGDTRQAIARTWALAPPP